MMRHDSDDHLLEAVHASWRELARSRVDPDLQIMGTTDMPDRGGKYGKVAVALFDNDDRLRGFVRMDHDQKVDRHVIYYTEIDEVHRGRGLGRELYVAAHGFAQSLGSDGLMSDTSRSPDSERLWKSLATAGLARYQVMFKGIVPGTSFGAWTMELSGDSSSRSVGSPSGAAKRSPVISRATESVSRILRLREAWGPSAPDHRGKPSMADAVADRLRQRFHDGPFRARDVAQVYTEIQGERANDTAAYATTQAFDDAAASKNLRRIIRLIALPYSFMFPLRTTSDRGNIIVNANAINFHDGPPVETVPVRVEDGRFIEMPGDDPAGSEFVAVVSGFIDPFRGPRARLNRLYRLQTPEEQATIRASWRR